MKIFVVWRKLTQDRGGFRISLSFPGESDMLGLQACPAVFAKLLIMFVAILQSSIDHVISIWLSELHHQHHNCYDLSNKCLIHPHHHHHYNPIATVIFATSV